MPIRSETELIRLIERLAGPGSLAGLRIGIGDDAAVLAPPSTEFELLATTDQIVENKHFIKGQHPPGALGHKLLARGLSDIAAMGGVPNWFLLSLAIPEQLGDEWVEAFIRGVLDAREKIGAAGLSLLGGDVSGADSFLAHITAVGSVPRGQALLRSGARPGDLLYVTGALGGSALGLERLTQGMDLDAAVERHLRPIPRLTLGSMLRESGASAALDVSDGFSTDLHRIAAASSVGMRVEFENLPRFAEATDGHVLHGGEEYELLFTAPPQSKFPTQFEGVRITRIGEATESGEVRLVRAGREEMLEAGGYEHLAAPRGQD